MSKEFRFYTPLVPIWLEVQHKLGFSCRPQEQLSSLLISSVLLLLSILFSSSSFSSLSPSCVHQSSSSSSTKPQEKYHTRSLSTNAIPSHYSRYCCVLFPASVCASVPASACASIPPPPSRSSPLQSAEVEGK
ncbi:hypothetical protein E2C01_090740 [Portunus trituberculatus]|uniref:Uncharacterized protein n=1 Tax=Portunus trituberculatus TaxID=210409 RepID=A0A5B7JT80_PORTR|nr:hypothetical protein [Portunus trituberculatus]